MLLLPLALCALALVGRAVSQETDEKPAKTFEACVEGKKGIIVYAFTKCCPNKAAGYRLQTNARLYPGGPSAPYVQASASTPKQLCLEFEKLDKYELSLFFKKDGDPSIEMQSVSVGIYSEGVTTPYIWIKSRPDDKFQVKGSKAPYPVNLSIAKAKFLADSSDKSLTSDSPGTHVLFGKPYGAITIKYCSDSCPA